MVEISAQRRVLVHYVYYSSRWDEWIAGNNVQRLAPHGSRTFQLGGTLRGGQLVDVLHPHAQQFVSGKIVEVAGGGLVRVAYHPPLGGEEWIPAYSDRLQPYGSRTRRRTTYRQRAKAYWGGRSRDAVFASDADPRVVRYLSTLFAGGLRVVPMGGDGNCLFRSVAHQVYGDEGLHGIVRAAVADYMEAEATWFASFVVGDAEEFAAYIAAIRTPGTWGDDPEIQAVCEIYNRPAEIFAYDAEVGARRLRVFHGGGGGGSGDSTTLTLADRSVAVGGAGQHPTATVAHAHFRQPIRLSYFGGGHYDSVEGPGWRHNLLSTSAASPPGTLEAAQIAAARARAAAAPPGAEEASFMAASLQASDAAATEAATLAAALRLSREAYDANEGNVEQQLLALFLPGSAGAAGGGGGATSSLLAPPVVGGLALGSGAADSSGGVGAIFRPSARTAGSTTVATGGAGQVQSVMSGGIAAATSTCTVDVGAAPALPANAGAGSVSSSAPAAPTVAAPAAPTLEDAILARVLRSSQDDVDVWQQHQVVALQQMDEDAALVTALRASLSAAAGSARAPSTAAAAASSSAGATSEQSISIAGGNVSSAASSASASAAMDDENDDPELAEALRMSLHGGPDASAPQQASSASGDAAAAHALPALAGDSDALYNMALEMTEEEQLQRLLFAGSGH